MRKKLLLGNWKMNKTPSEAKAFALAASEMVDYAVAHDIEVGVAPTFVSLAAVKENINPKCIVAAQNVNEHDHGAFTGEVSIAMLKEVGIDWVILGHSERREYNGETSPVCNLKIKALLKKRRKSSLPMSQSGPSALARAHPKRPLKIPFPSSEAFSVSFMGRPLRKSESSMAEASNQPTSPST